MRRTRTLVGIATLLWSCVAFAAPRTARIDGRLRMEVDLLRERGDPAARLPFFVKADDPVAAAEAIGRLGGSVGTRAGDILTVRAPGDQVTAIAAIPGVTRLEGAIRVRKRLDAARAQTFVDQVHTGAAPLSGTYTGKGVIVGVIDGGLDLAHAAFRNGAGTSRVIGVWDQTATGAVSAGVTYGSTCDAATLAADGCKLPSTDAHGTHVTGIAAGGVIAGSPYTGMAPDAAIAFVNNAEALANAQDRADAGFSTAVCDAAAWIFKLAGDKPTVVNMSLGSHEGPHDGSSLASQCLDNLTGPGKILVAAAGNEGDGGATASGTRVYLHAKGQASVDGARVAFAAGGLEGGTTLQAIWGKPNTTLSVAIGAVGSKGEVMTQLVDAPDGAVTATLKLDGKSLGPIRIYAESGDAGQPGFVVRIDDDNGDGGERTAAWFVEVRGAGAFDAFIDTTAGDGFVATDDNDATVDNLSSIGFPAIAPKVLAVAAFTSKVSWITAAGSEQSLGPESDGKEPAVGGLAIFSSRGPSLDPVHTGPKPDIAGPGQTVVAALHQAADADDANIVKDGPSGFVAEQGTSMAAPAVAGIVALMLQADPKLDTSAVRKLLVASANTDGIAATLPDIGWGNGRANAFAALQQLDAASSGAGAGTGTGEPSGGTGGTGNDPGGSGESDLADDEGCATSQRHPGGDGRWALIAALALGAVLLRRARAGQR